MSTETGPNEGEISGEIRTIYIWDPQNKEYRFSSQVVVPAGIDVYQEWTDFTARVGLRNKPENNFPKNKETGEIDETGDSFEMWLKKRGVQFLDGRGGEPIELDYID